VGADASRTVGDLGPNDAADWGAANYFSGTYNFWSNRSYNSVTQWTQHRPFDFSLIVFQNGRISGALAS
jgi:hypothetical protein